MTISREALRKLQEAHITDKCVRLTRIVSRPVFDEIAAEFKRVGGRYVGYATFRFPVGFIVRLYIAQLLGVDVVMTQKVQCYGCQMKFERNDNAINGNGSFSFGAKGAQEVNFLCNNCAIEMKKFILHLRGKSEWYSSEYD